MQDGDDEHETKIDFFFRTILCSRFASHILDDYKKKTETNK